MDADAIRIYVARDWTTLASAKSDYWAEQFQHDRLAPWRASQALLQHVSLAGRRMATEEDRDVDFDVHLRLRTQVDRAAHAFSRR